MKKILYLVIIFVIVFIIYYKNIDKTINYLSIGDYLSCGVNNKNKIENSFSDNINKYLSSNKKVDYKKYVSKVDYRVVDLINDINNNKQIKINNKKYSIKNLLIKADIVVLSIGMNDIYYQRNITNKYNYVDELLFDIDNLLSLLRKNCKEKIYMLNYYNVIDNKEVIDYTNNKLNDIASNYNVKIIDISNLDKYLVNNIYPTNEGYNYIYNQTKSVLQK